MEERIPMSGSEVSEPDIESVLQVLRSGRLALGPFSQKFENIIAEYVGVEHGVVVSSGTAALHLIVRALEIGHGDEVLVPSFTFAASVNVIMYENATPVFVDISPDTFNLDVEDLKTKITKKTKAIMAVDVFGHPADWDALVEIAARHELRIIDDSCEALGAEYRGRRLGGFGDAAAFAFYPNKQITTGEGGILVTDSDKIADLARSLRNQGRGSMGAWLEHERLGYNYRIDEMSAALGFSQFKRLEEILRKRERVAGWYNDRIQNMSELGTPVVKPEVRKSWFVYVVILRKGIERSIVIQAMAARGIPTRAYFSPIHQQPYVRKMNYDCPPLPVTEDIAKRTLALPFFNDLSEQQVEDVVAVLKDAVRAGD